MKKLKVERPDWSMFVDEFGKEVDLDKWFDSEIEPLNKILEGAQTVYAKGEKPCWWDARCGDYNYKACVINIEPIKTWQCPCGEIARFADTEECRTPLCYECAMEIKRALENRGQDEK